MRITESITVLLDFQTIINRLHHSDSESEQETMLRLWKATQVLMNDNKEINIDWISDHQEVKDNEQINQTVKKTVVRITDTSNEKVSLAHIRRVQIEIREAYRQDWLSNALKNKASEHRHRYKTQNNWRQDSAITTAFRKLVCHYVQLKSDHAAIEAHLACIKAWNSSACTHYKIMNESVYYVLLKCREWWI